MNKENCALKLIDEIILKLCVLFFKSNFDTFRMNFKHWSSYGMQNMKLKKTLLQSVVGTYVNTHAHRFTRMQKETVQQRQGFVLNS